MSVLLPEPIKERPPSIGRQVPLVSLLLAALCLLAYAYESLRFGTAPGTSELHVVGGFSEGALRAGNWWSFGMHQLLHIDGEHLFGNLFLLLVIGILVEVAWGWGITALVMGVSAIGSAIGTIVVYPEYVAVGASGIVAGLAGFALAQHAPPRGNRWALQLVALGVILSEALPAFLMDSDGELVDHAGHVGGLISGVLVALVLRPRRMRAPRVLDRVRVSGIVLVGVLVLSTVVGVAPRIVQVSQFAWHGVGSNPEAGTVPPVELAQLALDGITFDNGDILTEPDCSVDEDDRDVLDCSGDVRSDGTERRRDFTLDRDVEHLEFEIEFD